MTIVVQLQLCRFYFLAKRVDDIISIYGRTSMEVIWYIRNTFRAVKSKLTFRRIVVFSIFNLYIYKKSIFQYTSKWKTPLARCNTVYHRFFGLR